ncbi:MAG: PHP domain-containing protein [Ruminococcus sp.]|nr:PHP domain-containing protein [Ruminococcus sp.]
MMKADMHIHSTVSDGSLHIAEIVRRAEEKQLDGIVITDHDTLSHANQLVYSDKVKVLAGIEISAFDYDKNFRVHVLGYNIRRPEILEQAVTPTLQARHENSLRQIEILNQHGFEIDIEKLPKADGRYIYKQHIMDDLVSRGRAGEMFGEFYYNTFKNNGICHFDIEYMDPFKAVRAVKEAGGFAVLAHSGQQQNFELIPALVESGLDGLELNHHANSEKDKAIIKEYAERYGLFLTGGSDFHGRYELNSPDIGDYIAEASGAVRIFG